MGSMGNELPPRDSPSLHLTQMTPAEHYAQTAANSGEWAGALNQEQYFRREAHLASQDLTRDGQLTAWALVYQPNGVESRQVLAGCETYAKKGLVRRADGKIEEGIVHGVGSVFSEPHMRGRGYAGKMMELLGERLKNWQTEKGGKEAIASVLFSDIGKKFYAARGWQAFPSAHVALHASESAGKERGLPGVRLLKAEDIPALCEIDEKLVRQRLEKQNGDQTAVALIPNVETIQWHHAREDFVAKELWNKQPTIKGAVAGKEGERVWVYWNRVFTDPAKEPATLHILRLVIEDATFSDFSPVSSSPSPPELKELAKTPTAQAIAAVFAEAQRQAHEWGIKEVMLWNPSATALAAAGMLIDGEGREVEVVQREQESIASLRWYGGGSWEGVEWVCNEKYGWC